MASTPSAASAATPTQTPESVDAGRAAAIQDTLDALQRGLDDERTTTAGLQLLLQQQNDKIASLLSHREDRPPGWSKDPPKKAKNEGKRPSSNETVQDRPPRPSRAELMESLQALLCLEKKRGALDPPRCSRISGV